MNHSILKASVLVSQGVGACVVQVLSSPPRPRGVVTSAGNLSRCRGDPECLWQVSDHVYVLSEDFISATLIAHFHPCSVDVIRAPAPLSLPRVIKPNNWKRIMLVYSHQMVTARFFFFFSSLTNSCAAWGVNGLSGSVHKQSNTCDTTIPLVIQIHTLSSSHQRNCILNWSTSWNRLWC